jgi:protocatechuate 3,4-dioxygenase beta subunit
MAAAPQGRSKLGAKGVLVASIVALGLPLSFATPAFAAGSLLPGGPKQVQEATAVGGDQLHYQIPYFCASSVPGDNCNGSIITDPIPNFVDAFGDTRPLVVEAFTSNGQLSGALVAGPPQKIVWTATNLVAGDTGSLSLVLRIPSGLVPASGMTIINKATFDNAGVTIDTTDATTTVAGSMPGVTLTKTNNRAKILAGSNSTYTLKVCPASGQSHFAGGYVLSDDIPAGATIVNIGGGTETSPGHVEWTITDANDPGFDPGTGCFSRTITLNFGASTFSAGDMVTNNATVDPAGPAGPVGPVGDTDEIRAPEPNVAPAKSTDAGNYVKDEDPINFSLYFNNQTPEGLVGETTIQDMVMTDGPLPKGFDVASIKPGQWNGGNVAHLEVSTAGASGPWTEVATADGSSAQDVVIATPTIADASDGTNRYVRWRFDGSLARTFAFSVAGIITGSAETDPFLPAPGLPQTLNNCQTSAGNGDVNGTLVPISGSACAANTLENPQPDGTLNKSVDNPTRQPGDTGIFTLQAGNGSDATADMVIDGSSPATLTDCMPNVLLIDSITLNGWADVSPGSHSCAAGKTPIAFEYSTPVTVIPGGSLPSLLVNFHVSELGDPLGAAAAQTVTNEATLIHTQVIHCTTAACGETESVQIPVSSSLKSRKSVAGYFDPTITGPGVYAGTWTQLVPYRDLSFDISGDTYPGGPVDWQLAVLNSGNADVKDFLIIDTLPSIGDTGVKVGSQSRYSQFRLRLTGPIQVPTGYQVEYSTEPNPCRDEVNPIGVVDCVPPNWVSTISPWSSVNSFKVTLVGTGGTYDGSSSNGPAQTNDAVLEIGEEVVLRYTTKAPLKLSVYDIGGTTAFPYENLNPAEQVDDAPAGQANCRDENSPGDDPASTTDRCPVARNSFAYAGKAFSSTNLFADVPLGSEPPRVDVTVYGPPNNAIGDYVWFDTDADGRQEAGEAPVEGVRVELVDSLGNPAKDADGFDVDATFTDADGFYLFMNLPNGDYKVRFFPPARYSVSPADTDDAAPGTDSGAATTDGSPNAGKDSDGLPVDGESYYETPLAHLEKQAGAGEFDFTWDLGIFTSFAIGDYVWFDDNHNGVQDGTENPVVGATAHLLMADPANPGSFIDATDSLGNPVADDTTDANGLYLFDFLKPGTYKVEFTHNQAGYRWTTLNNTADDADSDVTFAAAADATATTGPIVVAAGAGNTRIITAADDTTYNGAAGPQIRAAYIDPTNDAGIWLPFTLGNLVWDDSNDDGIADVGEAPIAGVTVELYLDADDNGQPDTASPMQTDVTDGSGKYLFTDLLAGKYVVRIPSGQAPLDGVRTSGVPNTAANDETDNDNNGVAVLNGGGAVTGWLSGTVELGPLLVEPTDEVDGLGVGNPDEDITTDDVQGDWSIDFGFHRKLRIGNQVWLDGAPGTATYDNGVFDASESGIGGVSVELWLDNGDGLFDPEADTLVETTPTDTEGNYWFENVEPLTEYFVAIKTVPGSVEVRSSTPTSATVHAADNRDDGAPNATADYISVSSLVTTPDLGGAPLAEADAAPAEGAEAEANLLTHSYADNNSDLLIDFSFVEVPRYRLGNLVWIDADKNGIANDGEAGLEGVRVELFDSNGVFVEFMMTDVDGHYVFENLAAGDYEVRIPTAQVVLAGYFTSPVDEADANSDGDNNDNGTLNGAGYFTSRVVTLGEDNGNGGGLFNDEPTNETLRQGVATDDDAGTSISTDARGNLSVDFAFYHPNFSIGNEVWIDSDDNGVKAAAEPYVPNGVVVNLLDADGTFIESTTTVNGLYLFDSLSVGAYIVEIDSSNFVAGGLLNGYRSSAPSAGENSTDNDDNGSAHVDGGLRSPAFTLSEGNEPTTENPDNDTVTVNSNENLTVDFGVFRDAGLGDLVWYDLDHDGIYDPATEEGVAGVTVDLLWDDPATPQVDFVQAKDVDGVLIPSTTTDVDGRYSFTHLLGGVYKVVFHLPTGYQWTTSNEPGDDTLDSDGVYTTPQDATSMSGPIAIDPTTSVADSDPAGWDLFDPSIDAGIWVPLALGDKVFLDIDHNGTQDGADTPVAGATVALLMEDPAAAGSFIPATDADGVLVPAQTTGADGLYVFDNLLSGNYKVNFTHNQPGFRWTTLEVVTAGPESDSNAMFAVNTDASAMSAVISLSSTGTNVRAVTAGDSGIYDGPLAGTAIQAEFVNPTIDAGIWMPVAVGNYVWHDLDQDGQQGATELGVAGVTVTLLNADGTPAKDADGNTVPAFVTLADGEYVFDNLLPGTYKVVFSTLPLGYIATAANALGDDTKDSDADPATLMSAPFTLSVRDADGNMEPTAAGDGLVAFMIDPTIDLGIWQPKLAIGDIVWFDLNHNGVQDAGELPVKDITVELFSSDGSPALDADGVEVGLVLTDADGHYVFDNLLEGSYEIRFSTLPAGFGFTTQNAVAGTNANDSNPDSDGLTSKITLKVTSADVRPVVAADGVTVAAFINPTIDAGIWMPVAVGDYVWIDVDHDGVQDASETPVAGVTVTLLNADGTPAADAAGVVVSSAITDSAGHYVFDNLIPGTYVIQFSTLPAGFEFTTSTVGLGASDSNPNATGRTAPFTLSVEGGDMRTPVAGDAVTVAQMINPTIDAGIWQPLALGDFVWVDFNRNGTYENGETPVKDVKVSILTADGLPVIDANGNVVNSVKTDANGHYLFDNLLPGDYKVQFTEIPKGAIFTITGAGSTGTDSDADFKTGMTAVFNLSSTNPLLRPGTVADGTRHYILPTIDAGLIRSDGRSGALPKTGGSSLNLVLGGFGLLGLGVALSAATRRRKATI